MGTTWYKASVSADQPANLRELLQIPESHAVLFTQGGGTTQFAAVVLNLLSARRLQHAATSVKEYQAPAIDYVVTGTWSSKAYTEAQRLVIPTNPADGPLATPRIAATTKPAGFNTLPTRDSYEFSKDAAFAYYCENETINGVEFPEDPSNPYAFPFDLVPESTPIVADYSSSFISRPIPHIERHAVIYAGAQKNLGPSGVTVVIVRKDLLVDTTSALKLGGVPSCPIELEYKILADNASLYNTPPTFAIYVSALVLEDLIAEKGGIRGLEQVNRTKAERLYKALTAAEEKGVLAIQVKTPEARSWMNVTFSTVQDGAEKRFLDGAEKAGFRQIKGHRSVGGEYSQGPFVCVLTFQGIRASLYNAVTLETVDALVAYIEQFVKAETSA